METFSQERMNRRQFTKGMIVTFAVGAGVAGAVVVPGTAQAQSRIWLCGPSGGAGGNSFVDTVPTPGRVVKVEVRSGDRIDGLRIVNTFPNGEQLNQPWRGGNGGDPDTFNLEPDEYLIGMGGSVGTGGTRSARILSLGFVTNMRESRMYGRSGGVFFAYNAPAGFEIAGLFGHAGGEVDAIGVLFRQR